MHVLSVFARCPFLGPITALVLGFVEFSATVGSGDTYHLLDMPESHVLYFTCCKETVVIRKEGDDEGSCMKVLVHPRMLCVKDEKVSSLRGKRDSRRETKERMDNLKESLSFAANIWYCSLLLSSVLFCSLLFSSAQSLKIMKANSNPRTDANAREASLSPPPLKKRKVESSTTSRWLNPALSVPTDESNNL